MKRTFTVVMAVAGVAAVAYVIKARKEYTELSKTGEHKCCGAGCKKGTCKCKETASEEEEINEEDYPEPWEH